MANEIRITSNQYEHGIILTSEDGNVLEITVACLPSSEPTFIIGTYNNEADETYQTLYSCPVSAA